MPRHVRNTVDALIGDAGADNPALAETLQYLADTIDARDRELAEIRDSLVALSNRIGGVVAMVAAHDNLLASDGSDSDLMTRAEVRRMVGP